MTQQQTLEFLSGLRNGLFLDELHEAIQLARDTEQRTQRTAEVTIKLAFSPAVAGDNLALFVKATVSTKLPPAEHGSTIFYALQGEALLSRRDPRQAEMFSLRTVGEPEPTRADASDQAAASS